MESRKTDLKTKNPNWIVPLGKELRDNVLTIEERAKNVIKSMARELGDLVKFLESVVKNIEEMSIKSIGNVDEQDTDLKDLAVNVKTTVTKVKELMEIASNENSNRKQKMVGVNEILLTIPDLLDSIQCLDFGRFTKDMPATFDEMQRIIATKFSTFVEDSLPYFLHGIIDHTHLVISTDPEKVAQFKSLDEFIKNVDLTFLTESLFSLSKVIQLFDEQEIEYSLNEGSIIEKIKFKVPFSKEGPITLKEICEKLSEAYRIRMDASGYSKDTHIELFPFIISKLLNRKNLLDKLLSYSKVDKSAEAQQQHEELKKSLRDKAKKEAIALIDEKLGKYETKKKSPFTFAKTRENKHEYLQALKKLISESIDYSELMSKPPSSKGIAKLNENIKNMFTLMDKQLTHKEKKQALKIKRLSAKIDDVEKKIKEEVKKGVSLEHSYDPRNDSATIKNELIALAKKPVKVFQAFMYAGSTSSSKMKSHKSTSIIDNVNTYMDKIYIEISKALDPITYNQYFEDKENDPKENDPKENERTASSWIEDAGNAYKALKVAVKNLNDLHKECTKTNNDIKREEGETPVKNVLKTIEMTNRLTNGLVDLILAGRRLSANPFIMGTATIALERIDELKLMVLDVTNHPVAKYLKNNGKQLAKQMLNDDRLTHATKELCTVYEGMVNEFPQDKTTKDVVAETLDTIAKLTADVDMQLKGEDLPKIDVVMFTMRHFGQITKVLPHLQQLKSSLKTGGKQEAFKTLQEVNLVMMKFFLLADKIETMYHLNDNYITNELLSFNKHYDVLLMATAKQLDVGKLYFEMDGESLRYTIKSESGKIVTDIIDPEEMKKHHIKLKQPLEIDNLKPSLPDILKITHARGHAPAKVTLLSILKDLQMTMKKGGYAFLPEECFPYDVAIKAQREKLQQSNAKRLTTIEKNILIETARKEEIVRDLIKRGKQASHDLEHALIKRDELIYKAIGRVLHEENFNNKRINAKAVLPMLEHRLRMYRLETVPGSEEQTQEVIEYIRTNIDFIKKLLSSDTNKTNEEGLHPLYREYKQNEGRIRGFKKAVHCGYMLKKIQRRPEERSEKIASYAHEVKLYSTKYRMVTARLRRLHTEKANHLADADFLQRHVDSSASAILGMKQNGAWDATLPAAKQSGIDLIDIELEKLKQRRGVKFIFFAHSRRRNLENRIAGLTQLHDNYQKSGFKISEALSFIRGGAKGLRRVLKHNEQGLLNQVRRLDATITPEERGCKQFDYIHKASEPYVAVDAANMIEERINKLDAERKKLLIDFTHVKETKIGLLHELKKQLSVSSFKEAIETVRQYNPDTYYLLFEGRTGLEIKKLEFSSLSNADISHKIDVEIKRLEMKKHSKFSFFYSKSDINERIEALQALQMAPNFDVDNIAVVGANNDKFKATLHKKEQLLLDAIKEWREYSPKFAVKKA